MRINVDDADWDDDQRLTYQGRPYTGEVIETDRSGAVVALSSYVAGREDGPDWTWYPNGSLKSQGQAAAGLAVGSVKDRRANGTLEQERGFDEHGDLEVRRRWSEDGVLVEDTVF